MPPPTPPELSIAPRRQVAALCWRVDQGGAIEILLVTSRDTGRWVTPKGGRMRGLTDAQSAAQEALEEAGVEGRVTETPLGVFSYLKRLKRRGPRPTQVTVFALEAQVQHDDWREAAQRTRRWFRADRAAVMVDEPDLAALILAFAADGGDLGR
ncbi:MAG TPA: NUDIX hydrolase [Brevundimonas sp.]|uniref:NUDIX hydrolase n=1 Tax=Brevundimonas sp. TaxID=1871086 RepID=UPI002630753D|nr:NUDIX hydrolase [Brevundimonas sp.]HRO32943.1 NUDIX hydrolase [Brevundimonas sp.]